MKIVIATGVYPPEIGGPAQYAYHLRGEFIKRGHRVKVVKFSAVRHWPTGLRHLLYFLRLWRALGGARVCLALDNFSVAVPAVAAARLRGVRVVIRTGGDFLWEQYVERTGREIPLPDFYLEALRFNWRERLVYHGIRWALRRADLVVFPNRWFRDIMTRAYELASAKTQLIANPLLPREISQSACEKVYLWPTRPLKLKNGARLKRAFALAQARCPEISLDDKLSSHEQLRERLARAYVVCLPSLSEVSPNLINEAIQFGKPFILTKHCGEAEWLADFGILVDPFDENDLAQAISSLADQAIYQTYQIRLRNFNAARDWPAIAGEWERLLLES